LRDPAPDKGTGTVSQMNPGLVALNLDGADLGDEHEAHVGIEEDLVLIGESLRLLTRMPEYQERFPSREH
jgi:hypothetical protein